MGSIETYVFLDMGTTGPISKVGDDYRMPEITELSMVAVKRRHLFDGLNEDPRVLSKFQMCFKPVCETMHERSVKVSGLNDSLLEKETEFDQNAFNAMNAFINCLESPVCLVAHDGFIYHFPVLKHHFKNINVTLASAVKCTDSLLVFFDLLRIEYYEGWVKTDVNEDDGVIAKEKSYSNLVRYPFYEPDIRPHESYCLKDIYHRVVEDAYLDAKTAENRCLMMLKIAQGRKGFERWVQKNHCPFSEVPTLPSFEKTSSYEEEDDSSEKEAEVKNSSCEQKEDTSSSSRWYDLFNFF